MKSYATVMYPENLEKNEFWVGEVGESGNITGFTNMILDKRTPKVLASPTMLYYVWIHEDGDSFEVEVIRQYMAFPKNDLSITSLHEMVQRGLLDTIDVANKIMHTHRSRSN